ncbi:4-hydroxy-3-methylbut-2-enyl diphosphate reductase [Roseivirga pacifica]|uniref:4-hydroxy-3-methylbut-2-enyl diphosphate reductase n=1 Tax=Roseivirga pacifica TaxID=1267423 RepID=UPI002095F4B3|nr:4-hydroxy-3-methylbut-2-enyl diphosphate reductase [Roseivirga pacifica]MCO6358993.1 4-hydroxy-3-methylbut-2-enyl diphosphate reductase [Roseivirga pacifica]MCO6365371.1 4-hydroxy-3-methylbut-2-enyl diphosphate reductase [Roseivirga pacifica]MCO6371899.1 4-hydroxy-3-methylbut-2-enyl diphosphate reductase [Roseivirga pacifica]MCO6375990.1 4-hydroxy-3-methylbut-2-enyl diphosphate reductase [Roseivirga pacifica]MCO6379277.1 4-hydroxy-3-methylbut-2-enyl diphosphate reductase [Roseivirga pacific
MFNLKVKIDLNSGFCFGVVYAIEMAEDILAEEGELYCLGDIVHNDEEVRRLESRGLKIINHEQLKEVKNAKVLIRAHGEPPSTYQLALNNNIELIDASCPVVLKLQNRIKNSYDKSENIYIYGKHGHAEVVGLLGQTNNEAVVFQDVAELNMAELPKEITLYSQTTKSTDKFYQINQMLEEAGVTVNTNDTICRQVSNRDKELRDFAKKFDVIVFVSGTKSSNGKVLYKVCKDQNIRTHFVSSLADVKAEWFGKNESVGICGATSTPMWLMEDVKTHLEKL